MSVGIFIIIMAAIGIGSIAGTFAGYYCAKWEHENSD